MSQDDITRIIKEIQKNRSDQELVHESMRKDMEQIKMQLGPIMEVYASFQGFGSIVSWIFKFIIIPISVVIGIWISLRQIK